MSVHEQKECAKIVSCVVVTIIFRIVIIGKTENRYAVFFFSVIETDELSENPLFAWNIRFKIVAFILVIQFYFVHIFHV